jgi:hypothetical protein
MNLKLNRDAVIVIGAAVGVWYLDYLGFKYSLFWRPIFYDKLVHAVAGFLTGYTLLVFGFARFSFLKKYIQTKRAVLLSVFLTTLIVGIAWEIFEVMGSITFLADKGYWSDTLSDILFDCIGGCIAGFYFIKNYE